MVNVYPIKWFLANSINYQC